MKQSCKIWNFFRCHTSLQKALDFGIFWDFKCLDKGCSAYKWSLCGPLVVPQSHYIQQLANTGVIRCSFQIQAVGQICWSHGGPTAGLDEGLAKPPQKNADRKLWKTQSYKQNNSKSLHPHAHSVPLGWHERRASSSLAICASLTHGTWVCWSTHKSVFVCTKVVSRLGW